MSIKNNRHTTQYRISKRTLHVHCSFIQNSQDTETTGVSISGRVGKEHVVSTHTEMVFSHEKEGMPPLWHSMGGLSGQYAG